MIYLAVTDNSWFQFLREKQESLSLVNFWKPSAKHINILPGYYWYFVLKGKEPRRIGGYGKIKDYRIMPIREAWDSFGIGNGVSSLRELESKSKDGKSIGCLVLSECSFLPDKKQKTVEDLGLNFYKTIVTFKKFPEHQHPIFTDNSVQISDHEDNINIDDIPLNEDDARKRIYSSIVSRQGQGKFRDSLLEAYEGKCAVTEYDAIDSLEAAHISPYMGPQTNQIKNGILLRSDIHTLFDLGKLSISSEFHVILHDDIRESSYKQLHGKVISLPANKTQWPSLHELEKHRKMHGL